MHSKEYLEVCQALHAAGLVPPCEVGQLVARGFADLGIEVFSIVPGDKMISLFTGAVTPLGDRQHLFWVPSVTELTCEILERGGEIVMLTFVEGRRWVFKINDLTGKTMQFIAPDLDTVLARCLQGLVNVSH